MRLIDWEGRPAVRDGPFAWAVLAAGEPWSDVDEAEVSESGRPVDPATFDRMFAEELAVAGRRPPVYAAVAALRAGPPSKPRRHATQLVNWEGRPAIIFPDMRAFAVLGGVCSPCDDYWTEVDSFEVTDSGYVVDQELFERMFAEELTVAGAMPPISGVPACQERHAEANGGGLSGLRVPDTRDQSTLLANGRRGLPRRALVPPK